ncbi:maleylpyruvate isomerase N-terminal domain-containing protein [Oryzobacter terrae]|uniref:maleylpyruvate isomerase N-terminal domain-containing protein n=1 Tax=Oryzobacter terrae TaxID=1620385 RepID=UPI00366F8C7C
MADRLLELYPECAALAAELTAHPEVARRWTNESACAGMTVGGLATHLASQTRSVVRLLSQPPHEGEPISALEHYRRAAWVHTGLDEEVNVGIREGSDAEAQAGPETLAAEVAASLDALPRALSPVLSGTREPDAVLIPWQGWALTAHDFVLTRTMEVIVHADDLAVSIDVDPPIFPLESAQAVAALLAGVAVERHGQTPLIRALSRPQRAEGDVSAF